jgi:hypothetical protein
LAQEPSAGAQATRGSAVTGIISAPAGFSVQWPVATGVAAAALAGVGAVRWLRSRKGSGGKTPNVRIAVTPDPGVQTLNVTTEDARVPTLRLRGQPDPGRQKLIMPDEASLEEG